jgi:hypothetical protein
MPPTTTTPRLQRSTTDSIVSRLRQRSGAWALRLAVSACVSISISISVGHWAHAQVGYDPPRMVSHSAAADPAALLRQLLPGGASLLHAPQNLPFGAHTAGSLLVFTTTGPPKGYAVWYLTASDEADPSTGQVKDQTRLIRLRDPEPADEFIDIQVRAVFSTGAEGDKHIVVLDSASRAAPAGGAQQQAGSVWRKVGGSALRLTDESRLLNDVPDATSARARLAPALKLKPSPLLPGALPAAFLALPTRQVDLTRRERLDRVRVGSPWLQLNDPVNGFLDIRGDAGLPGYQLALFKGRDKTALIALQRSHTQGQLTWFLQLEGADWRDVSAARVPGYRVDAPYVLPRRGTTVQQGPGLESLRWTGTRFETP